MQSADLPPLEMVEISKNMKQLLEAIDPLVNLLDLLFKTLKEMHPRIFIFLAAFTTFILWYEICMSLSCLCLGMFILHNAYASTEY
jgi:ABC-type proline/glycine betaine transport system permease subunit